MKKLVLIGLLFGLAGCSDSMFTRESAHVDEVRTVQIAGGITICTVAYTVPNDPVRHVDTLGAGSPNKIRCMQMHNGDTIAVNQYESGRTEIDWHSL